MMSSGTSSMSWNLRFHATRRCVSSNIATPSPMFSKVTRSSFCRCASSSVRSRSARKVATLPMAMTACSAKVCSNAIWLSVKPPGLHAVSEITQIA